MTPISAAREKLIDWKAPLRSKYANPKFGMVMPDEDFNPSKCVRLVNGDVSGWGNPDQDTYTTWRYDEYGRCHSHKLPVLNDLENYDPKTGDAL